MSIIRRGRTVTTGTLADLRRHTRTTVHALTEAGPVGLAGTPGVADHAEQRLDGYVDSRLSVDGEHLDQVVGLLHAAHLHTLTPPSLDALFLRSYRDLDEGADGQPSVPAGQAGR